MLVVSATISVTHVSDPGCPWAYSAAPHHAVLQWRYGDQLAWRLAMIGLAEDASRYDERGYKPVSGAIGYVGFRRFGMPFDTQPRERNVATGRACRAVVAARLLDPATEVPVFRALQLARFTTTLLFDTDDGIRAALARVPEVDAGAVIAAIDDPVTEAAYQEDRVLVRTAAGSPTEFQGKAANSDGAVRYTAPSLLFAHRDGPALEAGGYQPVELRRARRARREIDEEVALEEDARPDLRRRVAVQRQPGVVDRHRHDRRWRCRPALDPLDLADLDARDPHRGVRAQPVGGREHRLDLERGRERDVLGEAEEDEDRDHDQREQADGERGAARRRVREPAIRACPPSPPAACRAGCW